MKAIIAPLAFCLMLAPAQAQDVPPEPPGEVGEGLSLLEQGAQMLLRGLMTEMEPAMKDMGEALKDMEPAARELMTMIGDLRNYDAPEKLPNGDILIRRKKDAPPVESEPDVPVPEAPGGDIEL